MIRPSVVIKASSVDSNTWVDMTQETIVPKITIDVSLHPIPMNANRSGLLPTNAMAGEIPTAANIATLNEDALMKYPSCAVEKCNLFASIKGRMVENADEETPLRSLMNRRGPIVG